MGQGASLPSSNGSERPGNGSQSEAAALPAIPWQVYICNACGLLYDEREGDADSGLAPGTRFADIPDDWVCPLCGVRKDDFVLYQKVDPALLRHATKDGSFDGEGKFGKAGGIDVKAGTAAMRGLGPARAGVVIVGAGRAGWQVAQEIRRRDAKRAITLVTGCSGDVYDKPMLSVAAAKAISPDRLVRERGADAAARLSIRLMPHTFATGLSPDAHHLRTTRGSLRYSHLVIAQGASPRCMDALPPGSCWRINHLDAYLRLRQHLVSAGKTVRHVAIVGAGLVGCELANDLALAGHSITLLDIGAVPLSSWLPLPAAEALLDAWKTLPIRFIGNVSVASLVSRDSSRVLSTTSGMTIVADEVISATGLVVARDLADSGALAWDNGIAVDSTTLATSAPDVFSLGDCITIDGVASRFIEPIGRQAQAIAGVITGIDFIPYVARPSPLRVKTSSCALKLDGTPHAAGAWRIDTDDAAVDKLPGAGNRLRMSQWFNGAVQARLEVS